MVSVTTVSTIKAKDMKAGLSTAEVIDFLTRPRDMQCFRIEATVSLRHRIQTLTIVETTEED